MNVEIKLTPEDVEAALRAYIRPKFPNHTAVSFNFTLPATSAKAAATVTMTEKASPSFGHNYR